MKNSNKYPANINLEKIATFLSAHQGWKLRHDASVERTYLEVDCRERQEFVTDQEWSELREMGFYNITLGEQEDHEEFNNYGKMTCGWAIFTLRVAVRIGPELKDDQGALPGSRLGIHVHTGSGELDLEAVVLRKLSPEEAVGALPEREYCLVYCQSRLSLVDDTGKVYHSGDLIETEMSMIHDVFTRELEWAVPAPVISDTPDTPGTASEAELQEVLVTEPVTAPEEEITDEGFELAVLKFHMMKVDLSLANRNVNRATWNAQAAMQFTNMGYEAYVKHCKRRDIAYILFNGRESDEYEMCA
jgi:nuclear transport factor 2 (NTF2) superfamily protein